MKFLSNLFQRAQQKHISLNLEQPEVPLGIQAKSYSEKDNLSTRYDNEKEAGWAWMARLQSGNRSPFLAYTFEDGQNAMRALLDLPCFHIADDSKKIICTQVLNFGYFQGNNGVWQIAVWGGDFTHDLWQAAKSSFIKHGGRKKDELEPEQRIVHTQKAEVPQAGKVMFDREDRQNKMGATLVYRIYKAPDAASAKAFLEQNPVTKPLFYIVVETPEGNYCRDTQGMYKE